MESDLALAGQGKEALFVCAVRPEGRIDFVGNDSRRNLVFDYRCEEAGLAQFAGKWRKRRGGRLPFELVDLSAIVIHRIK